MTVQMADIIAAFLESKEHEKEHARPAIEIAHPSPRRPWSKFARMLLGRK